MTEQLELTLRKPPACGQCVTHPEEVERFVELLWDNGGLLTTWGDRKCRALAARSEGRIISGNNGYKHSKRATPEEVQEFYGRMVNQGREMIRRAIKVKRVHHSYVG